MARQVADDLANMPMRSLRFEDQLPHDLCHVSKIRELIACVTSDLIEGFAMVSSAVIADSR